MKPSLLIVGLGNPGKQYEHTRHNAGFDAVDVLQKECGEGEWQDKQKFVSHICEARVGVVPVLLVKPRNYMNCTGEAVQKIVDFYKMDPRTQILVLCDDIDLPLGELRLREKGGPGTHNGLKSFVQIFGEEFPRLRIGIGSQPQGYDLAAWVLSKMTDEESMALEKVYKEIPERVREFVL